MSDKKLKHIKNVGEFVKFVSTKYKDQVAFEIRRRIINEKTYYDDLPSICNNIVHFFEKNKIKEGDKVLIWGLNCPEYSLLLLSLFALNRVAVPIDFRTSDETLQKIINQTKPKAVFMSRFLKISLMEKNFKKIFYIEDLFSYINNQNIKSTTIKPSPRKNNICEIVYTSGTTGTPKGVIILQDNILSNVKHLYYRVPKLNQYRTISILPLSHMFEQVIGLFLALSYGSKITYLPRVNSLKLKQAMLEVKPTYLILVPQILSILWDKIETEAAAKNKYNSLMKLLSLSSILPRNIRKKIFRKIHKSFGGELKFIGCGGAPLNYAIARYFDIMGFKIYEGYGATEVTAVTTFNINPDNLGTVGKPIEGVKIKLDADGQILIKSKSVSGGYYKNSKKTKETFQNGWYKSGDIGSLDNEENLIILGRDFFKIVLESGEKVYVEDLERKINLHPDVKDSCVFGIRDGRADKIHATLLLKENIDKNSLKRIIREINSTLESKQQIFSYSMWKNDDFPRTPTLKVDREVVHKIVEENLKSGNHPEKYLPTKIKELDVLDILSQISKIDKSKIHDSDILTSDLGMDSLDRAELTSLIEENLDVLINNIEIDSRTTVKDIKKMVAKAEKVGEVSQYNLWHFTKWGEILRLAVLKLILFPIHGFFVKIKVANPENLQYLEPKSIIIFNHPGLLDVVCILRILNSNPAKVVALGYQDIWDTKKFSRLVEIGGAVPIDQTGANLINQLRIIWDLVDENRFLFMAPQGRLQRNPVPDRFKAGIGFIAKELKLPIVPIKLIDYEEIWPAPRIAVHQMKLKDVFPKKIGTVTIKIGKRIDYSKLKNPIEIANLVEEEFDKL